MTEPNGMRSAVFYRKVLLVCWMKIKKFMRNLMNGLAKWAVRIIALGTYGLGLGLLGSFGLTLAGSSPGSTYGANESWQHAFENFKFTHAIVVGIVILFIILQLVPLLFFPKVRLMGQVWLAVLTPQAALGVGALTIWLTLNDKGGRPLVEHSTVFALSCCVAGSAVGALVAPALVKVEELLEEK